MRTLMVLLAAVSIVAPASAQYAESPRQLPVPVSAFGGSPGWFSAAAQIGRRLFLAGPFSRLAVPTGSAVVVDAGGHPVPGAFPFFAGTVSHIVSDGMGGWLVVGEFTSVNGRPFAGFARVAPNRALDERFRVVANGVVRKVASAHGRIYLAGDFTAVNGATRRGLAALDAASGGLLAWGTSFDGRGRVNQLSFSSVGVYAAGGSSQGHLWGLDATTGAVLFERRVFVSALAASSARVYVGGPGFQRPVWAVDPFTGQDTDWSPGITFQYIPATYGWDGTAVSALLLDGDRLYIGGRFLTSDGRISLTAIAAGGGAVAWRPNAPGMGGSFEVTLQRVGPAIAASFAGAMRGFDAATAAAIPLAPDVVGAVSTAALAPEGVVVGGGFNGSGGVARNGLASMDLDTYGVEPWIAAFPGLPNPLIDLATDGTWLFARTEGSLGGLDAKIVKIDPASGAVVAERAFPSVLTRMRVAGSEIIVATVTRNTSTKEVGRLAIAEWSYSALPVTLDGQVIDLDVTADTIYLAGGFSTVSGQSRRGFAAVHRVTGALLAWNPAPDVSRLGLVRTSGGRVWVAGEFNRVGGQRRRGLAELDPVTGAALPWNPDVAGILSDNSVLSGIGALAVGGDGNLYVRAGTFVLDDVPSRAIAAGQLTPVLLAYSTTTGRRLPWRPTPQVMIAALPDCLLTQAGCLTPAIPAPTNLQVTQSDASIGFSWNLPAAPARTGVRLEVGSVEGRADLFTLDLPADQQSFSAVAPAGRYFARVRALAGAATSLTTADVSFAVGPPGVPAAPLDFSAIAAGNQVTFAWQPPSTGAPPRYELEAGSVQGRRDVAIPVAGAATSFSIAAPPGRYWTRLVAVNDAGRSAASNEAFVDTFPGLTCSTSPPLNLAAAVSGRTVTLTWEPPADGSEDTPRIVAGSAPGQSDLASITAPPYATSFSVEAPPGVYYVRLEVGCFPIGRSNEVRVVVP